MNSFFNQKIIAITGGTSGIGYALALQLHNLGARVAVCGRHLNTQLSSSIYFVQADISIAEDCKKFIEVTISHYGSIDILINNAGMSMRAMFAETDVEVLKKLMDCNFWGSVYCTKYALQEILKNKGAIVGISSVAGYRGLPCRTGYSASKFALQGFLESLRTELLYTGVNVLWISPGFTASNIRNTALNATGTAQKETPLKENKLMSADECASFIIKDIYNKRRTHVMTFQGKLTVWINKFFPSFVDKQVFKHFAKEENSPLKKQ